MSTYYYIYAEARYKGKWYSINPIVKKADGTYKVKEVFWAQSGFLEMFRYLQNLAIDQGILDDFSQETRSMFHENLDDTYLAWGNGITYRQEYERSVIVVPYDKLKPHIVRDRPYKHRGYVFRECIPNFECGEIDDIENWITIEEYKALAEDEKKYYAYYEWNNRWDDYEYKSILISKIDFLSDLFRDGDSVEGKCGWIDVSDADIRLIVEQS